jgi:hypothetical protein
MYSNVFIRIKYSNFFVRLGKIDVFHGGFLAPSPDLPREEGSLYSVVARWLRWAELVEATEVNRKSTLEKSTTYSQFLRRQES